MPADPTGTRYTEVQARTITRLSGVVDPWFLGRYGMNLYRGCEHGCAYCDGRAERYRVQGQFDREITVKTNAKDVFAGELQRRKEPGFIMLGGGVCDAWQPAEAHYQLARSILELALAHNLPVLALTKSALIERDLDLLAAINERSRALLCFSIQTTDEDIRTHFEPGAAPLAERWRLLAAARERGIPTGVMAMPTLPGISDSEEAVESLVATAAEHGVAFILCSGLTLRPGVQRERYLAAVADYDAELLPGYEWIYATLRRSGRGDGRYQQRLARRFRAALARHNLPGRIPHHLFAGLMPIYSEVSVLLEHHAWQAAAEGRSSRSLQAAGWGIQRWARCRVSEQGRRRDFSYRSVEDAFLQIAVEDDWSRIEGVDERAAEAIRDLMPRVQAARGDQGPQQMSLV